MKDYLNKWIEFMRRYESYPYLTDRDRTYTAYRIDSVINALSTYYKIDIGGRNGESSSFDKLFHRNIYRYVRRK